MCATLHLQCSCNRELLERESSASASAQCAKDSERPVLTENAQRTVRSLKMHDEQRASSFKKKKKKEDARPQVLHVFLPARQSVRDFFFHFISMDVFARGAHRHAQQEQALHFFFSFFFLFKKMSCSNCEAYAARLHFPLCVYEARLISASCLRALLAARSFLRFVRTKHG